MGTALGTATALPAIDLADLLLLVLARRTGFGFVVTPSESGHSVSVAAGDTTWLAAEVPAQLGESLCARLGVLAGLNLSAVEQVGQLKVRAAGRDTELMVTLRHRGGRMSAEVRRVADLDDAVPRPLSGLGYEVTQKVQQRIGGYTLMHELGRGAMGVVYLGEHDALKKPVAIKVMSDRFAGQPQAASRFLREARAASAVRHPGVVDVTDFGILPDGRPFLAMELVQTPTLEDLIFGGALEPQRAVRIAWQIANAVAAAHERGVVHRDLKPANVFVGAPDDTIKIGDFGAAKMLGRDHEGAPLPAGAKAAASMVLGTPLYMAPEQAQGAAVDGRTDVYALGCILYEMLSGQPPFGGETAKEVITRHITDPVPRLASPLGPLPIGLEDVVRRALLKKPAKRIAGAAAFAKELEPFITPERRDARPTIGTPATRAAGWRKWFKS